MLDKQLLNRLYRYCFALTADAEDAWDLLQNAVEKYLRARPAEIQNQHAYLIRIIRNQRIDDMRANKVEYDSFDETVHTDTSVNLLEQTMIYREELEQLWRLLTPAEREVLFLWAAEGYSAKEIASQLGISRNTVLSRIFRARKKIMTRQEQVKGIAS